MGDITKYFTKHTSMSNIKVERLPKCEQDIADLLEASENNPKLIMDASLTDYERGILYFFGLGELRNDENGLSYLKNAADDGDVDAMNLYGFACYHISRHCGDDIALMKMYENDCIQYLMKAKNNGQSEGLFNLGVCYLEGKIVPINEEKGLEYINEAVKLGNAVAEEYLRRLMLSDSVFLHQNVDNNGINSIDLEKQDQIDNKIKRELELEDAVDTISKELWEEVLKLPLGTKTSIAGLYNDVYVEKGYNWVKKEGFGDWLSSKDDGESYLIAESELENILDAVVALGKNYGYVYKADGNYGVWLKN